MFAGLIRTLLYIVAVWFIWRWLDRTFGGRQSRFTRSSSPHSSPRDPKRTADDSGEGEYVDFEEVKD